MNKQNNTTGYATPCALNGKVKKQHVEYHVITFKKRKDNNENVEATTIYFKNYDNAFRYFITIIDELRQEFKIFDDNLNNFSKVFKTVCYFGEDGEVPTPCYFDLYLCRVNLNDDVKLEVLYIVTIK